MAKPAAQTFTVPAGSDLSLRVTGGSGDETLAYAADGMTREIAAEGRGRPIRMQAGAGGDVKRRASSPASSPLTAC
jgi:hypothetical protein